MRLALAVVLVALLAPAAAQAAEPPDLDGASGPRAARTVDLAGRWGFVPQGGAETTIEVPGGGWYKQGFDVPSATYKRRISVPDVMPGQVTRLELGAVNHEATLLVDGREVATNTTSYTPSVFDLTEFVRPGAEHEIEIRVKGRNGLTTEPFSGPTVPGYAGPTYLVPTGVEWSEGIAQGIFRSARLRVYPPVRIDDAFVRTSVADRTLTYDVWLANGSRTARTVRLEGRLRGDAAYPEIPSQAVTVPAGETKRVTVGPLPWRAGPESYWWPNVPYRPGYRAQLHDLELEAAEDALGLPPQRRCLSRRRFGIRLSRRLRTARVTVNGRAAKVRRRGGRLRATVDLRGLPRGRYVVRVAGVTKGGRRLRATRRYRTCAGWGRAGRRPSARAAAAPDGASARYRFGFREVRQVGTHYELNGVRVNFRGDSLGEGSYDRIDHGGKGDAYHTYPGFLPPSDGNGGWPQAVDNYLRLNFNTVRIHQIPASPYMLDVADEHGLMIIGESAIRGSQRRQDFVAGRKNMVDHMRALVLRDRHHASVLRWSQSNEPDGGNDSLDFEQELYRTIKEHDDTRPVSIDVVSQTYEEMKQPDFSVYQHYVNERPSPSPIGGYNDDVHPRDDRPFGKGEFLWPLSATPQVFTWFGTATEKMREKDGSDIRPYAMASTWPAVVPGVRSTDFLTEENTKILFGEDNLPDPWSHPIIRRVQQGFHPVLVADRDFWEEHKLSDPFGNWPSAARPSTVRAGERTTRSLVVFNDTFRGERIDVRWELRDGAADGAVVDSGAFAADVPLGSRALHEIAFTAPEPGKRVHLVLTASKPGEGELFREESQRFEVTP